MSDHTPYTTAVELFRTLEFAKSHEERMEIIKMARLVRLKLLEEEPLKKPEPLELSDLAQRLMKRCAGMKLTGQTIAHLNGRSYGGDVRGAVAELIAAKMVKRVRSNLYQFNGKTVCPSPDSPALQTEKQKM